MRALALFGDVPRAGAHTLVLELVRGGPLLEWACAAPPLYTQRAVAALARQLLSALHWLHAHNIAHLDIRVRTSLPLIVNYPGPTGTQSFRSPLFSPKIF